MASDEHPVYRFCIISFPFLLEIVDYQSAWAGGQIREEFPKTKGSWSDALDTTLFHPFKSLKGNVSLTVEQEYGMKKKDGTLTGCYRSIRDNESDFSLVPHDFPTVDYDKVDPYQVLLEVSIKMLSTYYSEAEADFSFNDFILTSIKSFDRGTWLVVLALISAFFGLWMTKRVLCPDNEHVSLRRIIAETLWDTLLLFISQESADYQQSMDRLLSILMTLSFFILTTIYFGLMSTDLVSVTKLVVINSYQEIMNRPNMTLTFPAMMPDHQEFQDAYENHDDSIQARFWAKYKDKVEMVGPSDAAKMMNVMQKLFEMNRVLLTNELGAQVTRRVLCRFKIGNQLYPNVYTWLSGDPGARMHQKVMIMRSGMKPTPQLKAHRRRMRSLIETGLLRGVLDDVLKNALESSDQFPIPLASHSKVERCLSDQVVYAGASVDTVVLQNYYILFFCCSCYVTCFNHNPADRTVLPQKCPDCHLIYLLICAMTYLSSCLNQRNISYSMSEFPWNVHKRKNTSILYYVLFFVDPLDFLTRTSIMFIVGLDELN